MSREEAMESLVRACVGPDDAPRLHLKLMSAGVRFLRDKDLRRRLVQAGDPATARAILRSELRRRTT